MITIEYESKPNRFVIKCDYSESGLVMGLPDRRFRKSDRAWVAPALRKNIEYMKAKLNNPQMYSEEALAKFNEVSSTKKNTKVGFPSWYSFKNAPMAHQKHTMDKAYHLDEYAILFEQGLGKTFTSINLASAWRMDGKIDAVVVVCPSSIKLVWEEELLTHCPLPTQPHVLKPGKYKKTDHFIENKTDFQWMIVGVEGLSQGSAHEYLERFLLSRRCLVIVDESSSIKTPNKTRTERCVKAGKLAAKRLILSGTSVTQGMEDLYTQFEFLNPDIVGFNSYYTFRSYYCRMISVDVGRGRPIQKIVGYQNEDEFIKSIAPYSSRVEKSDALDLPEKIFQNRYVDMSPAQKKMYLEMKHEMYVETESGNEYEVSTALEQLLRLQQISGGFYPHDDGESVVPKPIPGKNPKLVELMSLLDEIPGKTVIWCNYKSELRAIAAELEKKEIGYVEFHGGCSDSDKKTAVNMFRNNKNERVFLATKAAAYGLTLVEATTSIYYSVSHSLQDYSQSQDRIHRIGQKSACNYIHILANDTVDIPVLSALKDKQTIADLVYGALKANN